MKDTEQARAMPEPLMDTEAAARLLGVSPRTVETWVRKRFIPHVKLGQGRGKAALTRFQPETLRDWIAARAVMPTTDAEEKR